MRAIRNLDRTRAVRAKCRLAGFTRVRGTKMLSGDARLLPGCAATLYVSLRKQQSLRYPGNASRISEMREN